ncbi:hypothetical protein ABIF66_011741 [Bradyrhizobium japonicum]
MQIGLSYAWSFLNSGISFRDVRDRKLVTLRSRLRNIRQPTVRGERESGADVEVRIERDILGKNDFVGVLVGNMVGVLRGMGPLATISVLLPLTFGIPPVGAILMLSGVFYGAQYGGAICSILLNLPCHPPHAVTCLDGFPLTKQGRGGAALGITVLSSFVGASWGIMEMISLAPLLVKVALDPIGGFYLVTGCDRRGDHHNDCAAQSEAKRY